LAALAVSQAHAAPIEGEIGISAALLLMLLGLWAVVAGIRNRHELRHRDLVPERQLAMPGRASKSDASRS
jgi:hypothetical protein